MLSTSRRLTENAETSQAKTLAANPRFDRPTQSVAKCGRIGARIHSTYSGVRRSLPAEPALKAEEITKRGSAPTDLVQEEKSRTDWCLQSIGLRGFPCNEYSLA